jgi:hypothetical protein
LLKHPPIERLDPIGADLVECDASALLERLRRATRQGSLAGSRE